MKKYKFIAEHRRAYGRFFVRCPTCDAPPLYECLMPDGGLAHDERLLAWHKRRALSEDELMFTEFEEAMLKAAYDEET